MLQLPFTHHALGQGTRYQSYGYFDPAFERPSFAQHAVSSSSVSFPDLPGSMFPLPGGNGLVRVAPTVEKVLDSKDDELEAREGGVALTRDENLDGSRGVIEEGRPYRRKKKFASEPSCCPACGVTVRPQELGQHLSQELEKLYKIGSSSSRSRAARNSQQEDTGGNNGNDGRTPRARWETYKRIRANRQARIRAKNKKRKADEPPPPSCPICNEKLSGTAEELNRHVEGCLNRQSNEDGSVNNEEEVDVEGGNAAAGFEEYEWAGQRRVRASSMLDGGFSAAGMATSSSSSRHRQDEEEVDLVVDGDSSEFGAPQYSESDVITPLTEGSTREQKEREALREAVISPNVSLNGTARDTARVEATGRREGDLEESKREEMEDEDLNRDVRFDSRNEERVDDGVDGKRARLVVEALRERVRELEAEMRAVGFKCLICMEQYKNPVTSVCCWHVHCEQCWLHTLGAKKLCPQCNMITSPSDLRRIYM